MQGLSPRSLGQHLHAHRAICSLLPSRNRTQHANRKQATVVCQAAKRVRLVKRREKLPAKQRRRDKYQDVGRPVLALPGTPEFAGRLLTAINAANGPVQLLSIMGQHGEFLHAHHVSAVLSRLAGFATGGGITEKQAEAVQHCGVSCVKALRRGLAGASPLDLSRALYSMYRLRLYDQEVVTAVVDSSFSQMSSFQPDALSGLGAALGGTGHVPPPAWLDRYCLETYIRMSKFTSQDLANIMFGLAKLGHTPSAAWAEMAQRRLRDVVAVSGVNPPALVKFAWALATLQVRPSFNWMLFFTGEMRQCIDLFTARELATLAWVCARLSHTPDPLFVESWYKGVTRRLPTFSPQALLLALHSAALWVLPDPPPGKLLAGLLPQTQAMLGMLSGPEQMRLLWSCVNLRIRPDEQWMEAFSAAAEASVPQLGPGDLADGVWAFARLRYQPSEQWEQAAVAQVSSCLSDFTPAQLGVLLWAWRSVELPVPQRWEQVFRAAAEQCYPAEQLQDITRLLGLLADQNSNQVARQAGGPGSAVRA